jgi:pimeloyl-ACP methyl ester carboxylesterase
MPIAQIRGIDLHYETTGGEGGDVVVFVNGGFADHYNWLFVAPILAESFNVITFDGRGHGQSSGVVGEEPFENVEDLAALIEFLDVGPPVHVVGNSGGGLWAMHLAARRPELFRSVSVNEPPFLGLLANDPLGDDARAAFADTGARLREGHFEEGMRGFLGFVGGRLGTPSSTLQRDGAEQRPKLQGRVVQ